MKHWGKDSLHPEDRRLLYFRMSGWGVWWFRLEKMVWNYPRDLTSFPMDVGIRRHDKATPKRGGYSTVGTGRILALALQGLQRDRRSNALALQKVTPIESRVKAIDNMGPISPQVSTTTASPLLFREGPMCAKNSL